MSRKSPSTQSTQRRSGGRPPGSSKARSTTDSQTRQSASSKRSSGQSEGTSSRGRGRGNRQNDNQEWNYSQSQGAYGDSRREDERSFASRDYGHGRERPAYSSESGAGRGFGSMDPERRREPASREGRSSQGGARESEQDERRFTREIDSYYGRPRGDQGFRNRGEFREDRGPGDDRFRDRDNFREEGFYRSSDRESDRGDWRMNERDNDYAPSYRSDWHGDRGQDYGNENRGYEGSFREGRRFDREDDDRFYSGRGPRDRESDFSGSGRQSGGRTRSTSSRRRD